MASRLWDAFTIAPTNVVVFKISAGWERPHVWLRGLTAGNVTVQKYMGFESREADLVAASFEDYRSETAGRVFDSAATPNNNIFTIDSPGWWRLIADATAAGTVTAGLEYL